MQSSSSTSTSTSTRELGNANYRAAKNHKSLNDKRRCFWLAIDYYKRANLPNFSHTDRSLSCKNLGVVNKELAVLEAQNGNMKRAIDHMISSVENYAQASVFGKLGKRNKQDGDWLLNMELQAAKHLKLMYELTLQNKSDEGFVQQLNILCLAINKFNTNCVDFLEVSVAIMIDLANRRLHLGILLSSRKSFKEASNHIAEMYFPIEEVKRLSQRNSILVQSCSTELNTLLDDYRIQHSLFRSRLDLEFGKDLLKNLDDESLKWMDESLLACDHLRAALAIISAEGLDMALEAEICSHLGQAYLRIFNAEFKAKELLGRSVRLVLHFLFGADGGQTRSESWFAAAESGLREIERREMKRSDEERKKELGKDGTLDKIEKAFAKGQGDFIQFIYKEFKFVKADPPSADLQEKKQLIKALLHFHPDKTDQNNRRQYLICEEVTRYLNRFNETMKFANTV